MLYGAATWGVAMFVVFGVLFYRLHHWWFELPLWLIAGAWWGVATRRLSLRLKNRRERQAGEP